MSSGGLEPAELSAENESGALLLHARIFLAFSQTRMLKWSYDRSKLRGIWLKTQARRGAKHSSLFFFPTIFYTYVNKYIFVTEPEWRDIFAPDISSYVILIVWWLLIILVTTVVSDEMFEKIDFWSFLQDIILEKESIDAPTLDNSERRYYDNFDARVLPDRFRLQ